MKTVIKQFVLLLSSSVLYSLMAAEPPDSVNLKEKVRMSTLIVVGKMESIAVIDAKSRKVIKSNAELAIQGYALKAGEKACAEIMVARVLYPSATLSQTSAPNTVEVTYGSRGMTVAAYRGQNLFYLTRNLDKSTTVGYYPFFDWSNLGDPISKEGEVVRLIAAFNAIK
ncbi:MAG: hypothetical protein WCL71_09380 [Deltaproteobacteria bacterium]